MGYITYNRVIVLEPVFGNKTIEKILFYLLVNESCYGMQLSKAFKLTTEAFFSDIQPEIHIEKFSCVKLIKALTNTQ